MSIFAYLVDSDPVEKLAARISCILEKDLKKLQNIKKQKVEDGQAATMPNAVPATTFESNGETVDPSTSIADALLLEGLTLHVGDEAFHCVINPPRVKALALSSQPLSGLYMYADCDVADCSAVSYRWYVGKDQKNESDETDQKYLEHLRLGVERCCTKKNVRKPIHFHLLSTTTDPKLKVTPNEEGTILCCLAIPKGSNDKIPGIPLAATTKLPVVPGPDICPYHLRHNETANRFYEEGSSSLRVVSYNILSDGLAETVFSKDGLFPYCPDEYVAWSYRENLLLDEIIGYNADLICLQELDSKCFKGNFYKVLKREGFEGFFSNKSSSPEGVCSLWNTNAFEKLSAREYPTAGPLLDKEDKLFTDLHEIVAKCKPIKKDEEKKEKSKSGQLILELPHMVQVIHLKHRATKRHLLFCNTHLYWHPRYNMHSSKARTLDL